jgi:hypothetical protein
MVVVPKKNGKFKKWIDFKKLNTTTKKDPYTLPFTNEVINIVVEHEVYTSLNKISKYHQISIASQDQHKTTFVWVVMPFGVKNGLPTYQRTITNTFCEYIDIFMKIFLDDFTIFIDLSTHLEKLKKIFFKYRKSNINLNLDKCAFMVFLGTILGFIVSKKGKIIITLKCLLVHYGFH